MRFEVQIMMSEDKYPSIFSPQMEAIVFIILQIFFARRAVVKIGEYLSYRPQVSMGYVSNRLQVSVGYKLINHAGC